MQDKKRSRQRAFSFMSAHRDCCSRPRDFGQMLCIEHIASFWCFRYDKQGNSPVGGKIDLVIQLRGAAEIDFQKERRNDATKTAISCSCLCHDGRWIEHGIVQGSNGAFAPNAPIARERAMVILGRAMGIEPIENPDLTKSGGLQQSVVAACFRGVIEFYSL